MGVKIKHVLDGNGVKFYPITIANAVAYIKLDASQVKLSDFLDSIDYSGKADKVSGATNGNFAGLDANGNLTDSGYKAADFKTKQTAVTDPTVPSSGTTEATAFIDTITQNANGEITATKKNLPVVEASVSGAGGKNGLMTAAQAEQLAGLVNTGGEVNILEGVQVNGTDLSIDGNKKVNVTIAEGATNGTIAANGVDIPVHGLGSAAYEASTAFDADGAAAAVLGESTDASTANTVYGAKAYADAKKAEVIGESTDAASANTIYGAKAYADSLVTSAMVYKGSVDGTTTTLPTQDYKQGWWYKVAVAGTYAGKVAQAGDSLVANKNYASGATAANDWDLIQGNVAVIDDNASLVIGTATEVAVVEGVAVHVTQVEDTTKLECAAVADTTDYADVTNLFTAPAGD